jgi:LysM repeat protein
MADRRKKLVFACVLLVTGVGGAMLFRRAPTEREFPLPQLSGLVLQAIDPSASLPIPPLPPDSLTPEPAPPEPAAAPVVPPATPHLLGSIELAESQSKTNHLAPATTRTEKPVFELPEPARPGVVFELPEPASAGANSTATATPAVVKVLPVSIAPTTAGAAEPPGSHWRMHQVQEGETLSSLARRYLGAADRYPELFAANRDVLQSPDRVPVGVTLKVPTASSDVEAESGVLPAAPVVPIPRGAWRRGEH